MTFWVAIPLQDGTGNDDPNVIWRNYIHFKSLLDNTAGIGVCLEIGEDLPDNVINQTFQPVYYFSIENHQSLVGGRLESCCNQNQAVY